MTNNLYDWKRKHHKEWYEPGPVKIYTREEIDKWEKEDHTELWAKIDAQKGLKKEDIEFLDDLKLYQAEEQMEDILQGTSEHRDHHDES